MHWPRFLSLTKYPGPEGILRTEKSNVEATLMFCDPAGFTQITENFPQEVLINGLNRYLTTVTEAVIENRGTIASYIGDSVFAYWLAEKYPDHATRACHFVQSLRHRLVQPSCLPDLKFVPHIGIHTGRISMISIDREIRRELTLIGDAVNLASRLSALCAQYKAGAIISDAVQTRAEPIPGMESLGEVTVKGKELPVTLYKI